MKLILYIFLFLPLVAIAQYDFETRYFTIDAKSLPELNGTLPLAFTKAPTLEKKKTFSDFLKVTTNNYWIPVDMTTALTEDKTGFIEVAPVFLPKLKEKEFGFSVSVNGNNSRNGTTSGGIRNTVYKEMRPTYFCERTGLNLVPNQ